jgi:hypothetical protein
MANRAARVVDLMTNSFNTWVCKANARSEKAFLPRAKF